MSNNTIIGAVEIGTAKVVVLIGELVDGRNLNVIGMGQASSHGVKKGEILDFKAVNHCTHAALQAAEESAGTEIESVYLTQTGAHVAGTYNSAVVNVSAPDNRVGADDVTRAVKEARSKKLPEGRVYIHHIGNPFFLDGEVVADPVGMVGSKLEIGFWSVHGEERKISNHVHVVNDYYGARVDDLIVSGIASASICATDPEKRNGVLVVDIGCGTTDYVLYRNGFIVHMTLAWACGLTASTRKN
jgi:cell division protein FtsA